MTENFGEALRAYRKANYLTQKQLAELIGLSPNHIGTLESGKKQPRASTVAAFEELRRKRDWKNWRGGLEEGEMNADEMALYSYIWKGLKRLDAEQEKEVLQMFSQILDWM